MARILFAALLLLFTLPAAAQTPGDSIAFVTADWHTTDLGRGAACRYAQVEMFGSQQSISVVSYPARHFATQIVQLDGKGETTGRMRSAGRSPSTERVRVQAKRTLDALGTTPRSRHGCRGFQGRRPSPCTLDDRGRLAPLARRGAGGSGRGP